MFFFRNHNEAISSSAIWAAQCIPDSTASSLLRVAVAYTWVGGTGPPIQAVPGNMADPHCPRLRARRQAVAQRHPSERGATLGERPAEAWLGSPSRAPRLPRRARWQRWPPGGLRAAAARPTGVGRARSPRGRPSVESEYHASPGITGFASRSTCQFHEILLWNKNE